MIIEFINKYISREQIIRDDAAKVFGFKITKGEGEEIGNVNEIKLTGMILYRKFN